MGKSMIVIPFFQRHSNLKEVLESLEKQTDNNLEILICAFRPDSELHQIINDIPLKCEILSVGGSEWNVSRARNAGIKKFNFSSGKHLILLDSDIHASDRFVELHKLYSQEGTILIGSVTSFNPYINLKYTRIPTIDDIRWQKFDPNQCSIKWPICWSGNISVCRGSTADVIPLFDEKFSGWGAEDMEWSYRMQKNGWIFRFEKSCLGNHLDHIRNIVVNKEEEQINLSYFLGKWPEFQVEIISWLNDIKGCLWFNQNLDFEKRYNTSILTGFSSFGKTIFLGFPFKELKKSKQIFSMQFYNLLGVKLPFKSKSFDKAFISKDYLSLNSYIIEQLISEVNRVAIDHKWTYIKDLYSEKLMS